MIKIISILAMLNNNTINFKYSYSLKANVISSYGVGIKPFVVGDNYFMNYNIHAIYKIKNIINGKIYIGSALCLRKRINTHTSLLNLNKHYNKPLQSSWNKYGKNNFIFEILEQVENKNNLIKREQYWIDYLNPEYNIRKIADSNLGTKRSEETKIKMSVSQIGKSKGRKHSLETRQKIKDFWKINGHPFLGKHHKNETKKILSDYFKKNPVVYWKGKKRDEETRLLNIARGKKMFSKKVMDINTGIIYDSIKDACINLGYKQSTIYNYFRYNKINKTSLIIIK